jgi:hypothetical protein
MENLPNFETLPAPEPSGSSGKKPSKSKRDKTARDSNEQDNRKRDKTARDSNKRDNRKSGDRRRGRLKWHPAFLQAMQMELFDYRDFLEFKYEHQLTTEPLRIDLLIIKKPKDLTIDKNIARIFRSDNIIEYKSPEDYISIKDFLKVYAYANLYAAITPNVDLSEVTLTFVESRHPRKLLKYLSGIRGYSVEETSPGIYFVAGDYLPIQIIESKKLSEGENLWLNSLRNNLKAKSMNAIIKSRKSRLHDSSTDAYLDVIFEANRKTAEANDMSWIDSVTEIMERKGIISEWKERSMEQGLEQGRELGLEQGRELGRGEEREIIARNLLEKGMSCEFVQEITGLNLETIQTLGG